MKCALRTIILPNVDDIRTEFEFWATQHFKGLDFTCNDNSYVDSHVNAMWIGYAGRTSEMRER